MAKYAAFGTRLAYDAGGGFYNVECLKDFTGPNITKDTTDVTCHGSPGKSEQMLGTLADGDTVTFQIEWDDSLTSHRFITDNIGGSFAWQITWPSSSETKWTFTAFISGFSTDLDVESSVLADVTLTVSGAVTVT